MTIEFDGRLLEGRPGQTIAGVLLAAGEPCGVFCGIGICFGCLVTVNGVPDVRACQRPAREGDVVAVQGGREGERP
ncbi:(2Fe-2S)-binding protein [Streptacidiphilus jiangxiensis]|uniref:2Fe-2S iron-sulfur cluster binding domain-containing protein n=1 Tax=Streptacidiphilus jiangxiensis TaxID=235985 RepID=A0A1H7VNG6_STRJI|nr:(2Fe-2S)-binding protein [Streptacidiphilus jiangxiensis]SEM10786.1 2Fe-2S iron-sulfur cluster binding domain-containing protein [Streptacidiphilus jiangxiensis]